MNSTIRVWRSTFLAIAFWFGGTLSMAQTANLGEPISWQAKQDVNIERVNLPSIDVEELKSEDAINHANKVGPYRFGFEHVVEIDLMASGTQTSTPDGGQVYRLAFKAKEAITMNVFFYAFELEEGESVYVYDKQGKYYDGAYTSANNQPDGLLSTMPIPSNEIVVEYYRPANSSNVSELVIGHVVEGYRDVAQYFIGALNMAKGLNDSGPCNYDTGCSELPGNPFGSPGEWNDQIAAVALMLSNGSAICTGALVNNTANDGTPYFLSANHCGTSNGGGRSFLFGYESPDPICATSANSTNGPTTAQINGAALRASNSGSDVALWELNSTPPASYNVYYAGWDRSGDSPTEITGIHHPSGDVKKMCREEDSPYYDTAGGAAVWWIDEWEWGVTEPGSSGSPIFDQNKRIVGQLYGGLAACSGTVNNGSYDYYGRFDVSWDNGGSASTRLSDWLDPLNENPLTLDGFNPNAPSLALDAAVQSVSGVEGYFCNQTDFFPEVVIRNAGIDDLNSVSVEYFLNGNAQGSVEWSGNLSTNQTATIEMPSISVSSSGVYNYSVELSNPNGTADGDPSNNEANSSFEVAIDAVSAELAITFDCWANEITWELVSDATGNTVATGGGYSSSLDGQTVIEPFCLAPGCYTFSIFDSYGDGMNGSAYTFCGIDGDYNITDGMGGTLVTMTAPNADFGSSATHSFCVEDDNEVPCTNPYPQVQNLSSTVESNGVLLEWDPIEGSIGCQIKGKRVGSAGSATINVLENEASQFFVSQNSLQSGQEYEWRVRCACSTSPLIIGPFSAYDYFTFGVASKIADNSHEWRIFPNPVKSELTLEVISMVPGAYNMRILDVQARVVSLERVVLPESGSLRLDLSHLDDGMYILELYNESSRSYRRFMRQ